MRNHLELQDLIVLAHNDAKSLNYVGADEKYSLAKEWVRLMREFIAPNWDYSAREFPRWGYSPTAIAKEQKNANVNTMEKLREDEGILYLPRLARPRFGPDQNPREVVG